MDDFVKKAFGEAIDVQMDVEAKSFIDNVYGNIDTVLTVVGMNVGVDRMDRLAESTMKGGVTEIFADFLRETLTIAFHIGYKEGRESR